MNRVVATDFGIWPSFKNLLEHSDAMAASTGHWAALANYLILYDQIIIPTGNLQVLSVLRLMLGDDVFEDMIVSKAIVLARYDEWFGYFGNGGGIQQFTITGDPDILERKPNLAHSYFQPLDQAIDIALLMKPDLTAARKRKLRNLLFDNVVELPAKQLVGAIKDEAYADILNSPYLLDMLRMNNAGRSLDRLRGVGPKQVTIFNPYVPANSTDIPEVRAVLRVAFENLLLGIGRHVEASEITGDAQTLNVLRAKGQRFGFAVEGINAFTQIQQVSGVPDLGEAFAKNGITAQEIIRLRNSKHCQALRDWFGKGSPSESAEETLQRYIETIGKPSLIEGLPLRALRFATTNGVGFVAPVAGMVLSAIDSFLLGKMFPGKSPRLFMKQAKVLMDSKATMEPPIMHGKDRNKPCPCGSGFKFKKCHGQS